MIKYVSGDGKQAIRLDDGIHYIWQEDDLRNYDWSAATTNRPAGTGGLVDRFTRPVTTRSITVGIRAETHDALAELLNRLHAVCEADIQRKTPGKLYIGKQYVTCYLAVSSKVKKDVRRANTHFVIKEMRALILEPFWTKEQTVLFARKSGLIAPDSKRYWGRYPMRYGTGLAANSLLNTHFAASPFVLTIYGPCTNPIVTIAGNQHGALTTVLEGERLIIDQLRKTVYKVGLYGNTVNQFDRRTKEHDPFKPAPSGKSLVQYNGSYAFEVTLHFQRSEPEWT